MKFKYKNTEKLYSKYEWISTVTAAEVQFDGKLSMGCPILNEFMRGGLPLRGITEISGESASGKTQLCLQLSIITQRTVQEGGLDGAVLFICTEDPFPIKRLLQLLNHHFTSNNLLQRVKDRILIEHIEDVEGLQSCLEMKLPVLANKNNIKLVVIDSIAALFRCQFECSEAVRRANKLFAIGSILHNINEMYEIAVVCINQVTDIVSNNEHLKLSSPKCAPSLGLFWSNIINTRIMLTRTSTFNNQATTSAKDSFDNVIRKLEIIFSPYLPPSTCYFMVNSTGVNGLEIK